MPDPNISCNPILSSIQSNKKKVVSPRVWYKRRIQGDLQSLSQLEGKEKLCKTLTMYFYQLQKQVWTGDAPTRTWSSTVTSVASVLSVFHFWLKLRPSSFILYLVSRLPEAFPVSVLLEPDVLNSWREDEEDKPSSTHPQIIKVI